MASNPLQDANEVELMLKEQMAPSKENLIEPPPAEKGLDDSEYTSICGKADVLQCCPSPHQLKDATLCNRLVMACFAVVLLWMSSLSVALSIVQHAIPTPATEAVYTTCNYALEVSSSERKDYIACADRQLASCDLAFDEAIEGTLTTVLGNFDYNSELLEAAKGAQEACAAAVTNAQAALGAWQEGGADYTIAYDTAVCEDDDVNQCTVACSLDDSSASSRSNKSCTCGEVQAMVNDVSQVRSESFGQVSGYAGYAASVVDALNRYSSDRAKYDAEYIANHTTNMPEALAMALAMVASPHINGINVSIDGLVPDVDALISCVSLRDATNFSSCVGYDSVRERYTAVMSQLEAQAAAARETFEEYASAGAQYYDDVTTAMNSMRDFFDSFDSYVLANEIDTSTFDDWYLIGIDDFLVSAPNWPSGVGITSGLNAIPSANDIWAAVSPAYEQFLTNISLASLKTRNFAEKWSLAVSELTSKFPGFTLDDYNPPQYSDYSDLDKNATAAQKRHADETTAFKSEQGDALDAFAQLDGSANDDDALLFGGFNFSVSDGAASFVSGLYFPFVPLVGSSLKANLWMTSVGDLASLLVIFDMLYRTYRSFAIFARFWSRSGVAIPDVDMRVDRDQVKFAFMSPTRMILHLVTTPTVWNAIIAIFAAIFVVYFCAIYVPVLTAYKQGCVTGQTNGTFLSNNLYSVAYNYAASDGNEDVFNGLSDFNVAKADYCSTYAASTQAQQSEDELFVKSLKAAQRTTRDDAHLMAQCVDEAAMDEAFTRACCGSTGYDACSAYGTDDAWFNASLVCPINDFTAAPFQPVGTYLKEPACAIPAAWDDWALKDAVFLCSDIPDCASTCSGPSQPLLHTVTEQCSCSAEWLLHASFLRSALGTVVYFLLNGSRIKVLSGLCKLLWRYLSPGVFTYKATCDHRGNVLAPRDTEKFHSFTGPGGSLKKELDRTLRRFTRGAWLEICVAAAMHALWIYFLAAASQDIQYDPAANH